MHKVLLVDDEKIILQGISSMVEWGQYGTELMGTATNGQAAHALIQRQQPDIIITDIKMPVMNGLELIKRVREEHPGIRFIILSGHEEFDFAKQAMEYEVKYYLLKPCNPHKIAEVLSAVVEDLNATREKESYIRSTVQHLEKAKPQIQEQLLRELLTNKSYGLKEWEFYQELLPRKDFPLQAKLILMEIDNTDEYIYLFALKNIAAEILQQSGSVLLSTALDGRVVLLIEDQPKERLLQSLKKMKEVYTYYYGQVPTMAISDAGEMTHLRQLYKQTMGCLKHRFYYGQGSILTRQDIPHPQELGEEPLLDHEQLVFSVRSGNGQESEQYIQQFFDQLKHRLYDMERVKSYSIELFMIVIRQAGSQEMDGYVKRVGELLGMETLESIQGFISEAAAAIAGQYYESQLTTQSQIVRRMLQVVQEQLADESLSLVKLAGDILYMNPDYLGKLFKKETGCRFTTYLMNTRMEAAKKLIASADDLTILSIAEQVGFGNNPKYFSQVFKKETGHTPSDYKRMQE